MASRTSLWLILPIASTDQSMRIGQEFVGWNHSLPVELKRLHARGQAVTKGVPAAVTDAGLASLVVGQVELEKLDLAKAPKTQASRPPRRSGHRARRFAFGPPLARMRDSEIKEGGRPHFSTARTLFHPGRRARR